MRLEKQIAFIVEIDKLKKVLRRSLLTDGSRFEDSAEHSWHASLMALVLFEHRAQADLDLEHILKMLLIHDLVEIDAGDTYCYDAAAHQDKQEREVKAADRIFGLLPEDQAKAMRDIWDEFEQGKTEESRFARALDRLNPFLLNYYSGGKAWKQNGISKGQVLERMAETIDFIPALRSTVCDMIDAAVSKGWLKS